ncbi:MAG: hypothetical protein JNM34_01385 [Chthonomonadaceae bacterium]|nr:hypothetical protein [Chthonomonadaceae bacterium]
MTLAFALLGLASHIPPSATKLIDATHSYFQSQFDNLELTRSGKFGMSRIEVSSIGSHVRSGKDPSYSNKEYATSFRIFGSSGHPLSPETVALRYSRFPGGGHSDDSLASRSWAIPGFDEGKKIKTIVAGLAKGVSWPVQGPKSKLIWQARPIVLSKKECLSCHSGLLVGDPVAIAVYVLNPIVKRTGAK